MCAPSRLLCAEPNRRNQDRAVVQLKVNGDPFLHIFGVADGHGEHVRGGALACPLALCPCSARARCRRSPVLLTTCFSQGHKVSKFLANELPLIVAKQEYLRQPEHTARCAVSLSLSVSRLLA